MRQIIIAATFLFLTYSCFEEKKIDKGFQVNEITKDKNGNKIVGLPIDSLSFDTRPMEVLLTKHPEYRLMPLFKISYNSKGFTYSGEVEAHFRYTDSYYEEETSNKEPSENNWNGNYLPGLNAVYGYNMINISLYNSKTKTQKEFFEKPALIKTLYYPANSKDTLNYQPVTRDYYMVSAYDEDTNKDGFINIEDLRHFYLFNLDGELKTHIIPKNYSVTHSEYDSVNDVLYVYTRWDKNNNGKVDTKEPVQIFWIDLKNPENNGIQYQNKQ